MFSKNFQLHFLLSIFVIIFVVLAIIFTFIPLKQTTVKKEASDKQNITPTIPIIPPTNTPSPTPTISVPQISGNQLRVPILTYHYIGNNPNPNDKQRNNLSVPPDKFTQQMKYLVDNGYHTITLDSLYPALKKQGSLPDRPVILTFDDGYEDFYYNAYPILRQFNLQATVFIPTALMDQGYYLKWSQIQEMASSGLISFQSHGVHHYSLPALSDQGLSSELQESKKVLAEKIGMPINFIAYPYGTFDSRVIEAVKKAGYIGALSTIGGKIQSEGTIYNMFRLKVGGGYDISQFAGLL